MKRRVYIAGPMSGYDDHNYPAFYDAEKRWKKAGWDVLNPARSFDGDKSRVYTDYLREDVRMISRADAIAFLPGWNRSKGALFEHGVAKGLNLPMYDAHTLSPLAGGAE